MVKRTAKNVVKPWKRKTVWNRGNPTLDLMAFDEDVSGDSIMKDSSGDRGWKKMVATVDSGAAHSVFNGEDWPMIPREGSEGSEKGQVYLGPGSERIPNRGQKKLCVKTEGSDVTKNITFQDAKVRKPLVAVSGCTSKGDMVVFDGEGSFIVPGSAVEAQKIRKLVGR